MLLRTSNLVGERRLINMSSPEMLHHSFKALSGDRKVIVWPHAIFKKFFWCGFPGGSDGRAFARNVGDLGLIPGPGRSPGEGNGNPLQYSCLENSMDGGAWWATVHGVAESDTTEWLHFHFHFSFLKSSLNLLWHCFYFMFWIFGCKACGI